MRVYAGAAEGRWAMAASRALVRVGALVSAVALTLSMSGLAAADEPQVLEGFCSFPITHEFPKFHSAHAAPVPTTRAPFEGFDTGQVKVVVTNVLNGKAVTLNASSAVFYLWDGTAYFRGSSVTFFDSPRGDIPAGVWLVVGDVHATFDDEGHTLTASGGVLRRNICAELA
jgi:hypothetical protein